MLRGACNKFIKIGNEKINNITPLQDKQDPVGSVNRKISILNKDKNIKLP